MVMPKSGQQGQPSEPNNLGGMVQQLMGLPSPDKVLAELQRLNTNMERLTPDIHKLSSSLDGLQSSDLRNLTVILQQIYSRIWR